MCFDKNSEPHERGHHDRYCGAANDSFFHLTEKPRDIFDLVPRRQKPSPSFGNEFVVKIFVCGRPKMVAPAIKKDFPVHAKCLNETLVSMLFRRPSAVKTLRRKEWQQQWWCKIKFCLRRVWYCKHWKIHRIRRIVRNPFAVKEL